LTVVHELHEDRSSDEMTVMSTLITTRSHSTHTCLQVYLTNQRHAV